MPSSQSVALTAMVIMAGIFTITTIFSQPADAAVAGAAPLPVGIPHHSLIAPFLASYAESGLPFWTFGGSTVVTDTDIVLTPPHGSDHGYLWNHQPMLLTEWSVRYAVRGQRKSRWASMFSAPSPFKRPLDQCGVAFWYLREPAKRTQNHLFGVPDAFTGAGVIVTHGKLIVVTNAGQPVSESLEAITLGQCALDAFASPGGVEIILGYSSGERMLTVNYRLLDTSELLPSSKDVTPEVAAEQRQLRQRYVQSCTVIRNLELPAHYYFGWTGQSSDDHDRGFHLSHVEASATSTQWSGGAQSDDEGVVNATAVTEFDALLDKDDRNFWSGRGDVSP